MLRHWKGNAHVQRPYRPPRGKRLQPTSDDPHAPDARRSRALHTSSHLSRPHLTLQSCVCTGAPQHWHNAPRIPASRLWGRTHRRHRAQCRQWHGPKPPAWQTPMPRCPPCGPCARLCPPMRSRISRAARLTPRSPEGAPLTMSLPLARSHRGLGQGCRRRSGPQRHQPLLQGPIPLS